MSFCVLGLVTNVEKKGFLFLLKSSQNWNSNLIFILPIFDANVSKSLFRKKKMYLRKSNHCIIDEPIKNDDYPAKVSFWFPSFPSYFYFIILRKGISSWLVYLLLFFFFSQNFARICLHKKLVSNLFNNLYKYHISIKL